MYERTSLRKKNPTAKIESVDQMFLQKEVQRTQPPRECQLVNISTSTIPFITHRNQKDDLWKAKRIGIDVYNNEQKEKMQILDYLFSNFNDGRKKTLFCQAVNLLELKDLRELLSRLEQCPGTALKEKGSFAAEQIKEIAIGKGVDLTLRRKK